MKLSAILIFLWTCWGYEYKHAFVSVPHRTSFGSCFKRKLAVSMSMSDSFGPKIPEELGVLPFPIQDIMMPGETKKLHLYEARFLSLFQEAMYNRDELIVQAVIVEQPNGAGFCSVGNLLKVTEWDRLEIGVTATVKSIGRVRLHSFPSLDPYLSANVKYLGDTTLTLEKTDALKALTEEIYSIHDCCLQLNLKLASTDFPEVPDMLNQFENPGIPPPTPTSKEKYDERMTWGHEQSRSGSMGFDIPLKAQLEDTLKKLDGEATSSVLCAETKASPELLSLQAASCLSPEDRLKALETINTLKRMKFVIDSFTNTQKLLAAKSALRDLNL